MFSRGGYLASKYKLYTNKSIQSVQSSKGKLKQYFKALDNALENNSAKTFQYKKHKDEISKTLSSIHEKFTSQNDLDKRKLSASSTAAGATTTPNIIPEPLQKYFKAINNALENNSTKSFQYKKYNNGSGKGNLSATTPPNIIVEPIPEPLQKYFKAINNALGNNSAKSFQYKKYADIICATIRAKRFFKTLSSNQDKFTSQSDSDQKKMSVSTAAGSATASPTAEELSEAATEINQDEPTFASSGLDDETPVGFGGLWLKGTNFIRFCLFPFVAVAQRNAAKMNNYMPQMQAILLKITEARKMGKQVEVEKYLRELMNFMKEKKLNPFKNMILPLAQMPVFINFFITLMQTFNVPDESLRSGGIWCFTDITMSIITRVLLYLFTKFGTHKAKSSSQKSQTIKYVLIALPIVILSSTFPKAAVVIWVSINFISLLQVGSLRIPSVWEYLKSKGLNIKPIRFTDEEIKDISTLNKKTRFRRKTKLDEQQYQKGGEGPIVQAYKNDPNKQNQQDISTKKS